MSIREQIADKLIAAGGFWSYDEKSVRQNVSDEQLIEATLEKLDLDDIDLLFQGDFYHSLNRFYAWYYFDIRYPDRYLKAMLTRHLSKRTA